MRKLRPVPTISLSTKDACGRLNIIEIGEPFQSGGEIHWSVPYKIRLKSGWWGTWGSVKRHKLALRNDNKAGRYVIDGGI